MTVDLRRLFDKYRISWRDRGANTAKHCVNICCPLCGSSDSGFHMGVNENGQGWYCLRNQKHNGKSYAKLFQLLHIPKKEWAGKVIDGGERSLGTPGPSRDYREWMYFLPAEESVECCDYLAARGFTEPVATAKRFNLRFAPEGRWVGRLLIPLSTGWTGRAMRSHMELRYKSETDELGHFECGNRKSRTLVLLEGPLDAMRLATVNDLYHYHANLGKRITASLIMQIRLRDYSTIYYAPDGDVSQLEQYETVNLLESYCTQQKVITIQFPKDRKDACGMTELEARKWLATMTTQQQVNWLSV